MDHNPEICKPYFETGHCAYGDSCIYIHDRTDYKSGHQLDQEYGKEQRRRARKEANGGESDPDDEGQSDEDAYEIKSNEEAGNDVDSQGFPFFCAICQGDFDCPVQTTCSHYFCEECALSKFQISKNC